MDENPLDLERHEQESIWPVFKRWFMFALLIALCVTFAAPTFGSCSGALGTGGDSSYGSFRVGGEPLTITRRQFDHTSMRLGYTLRLLGSGLQEGDEAVWSHILTNAAAEAEGVHVSDARAMEVIAGSPLFTRGGEFDMATYKAALRQATGGNLSDRDFRRTLAEILRGAEYRGLYQTAFQLIPSSEAFERWRKRNQKLTVEYVAMPFSRLRAEIAEEAPADDVLERHGELPRVKLKLQLPARKTVEAAYLFASDVPDDMEAPLHGLLAQQGLIGEQPVALDAAASRIWWDGRNAIFTRTNWLARQRPLYELAKAAYEEAHGKWEAGDKTGPEPEAPPSPEDQEWNPDGNSLEIFETFWKPVLRKEVLARLLTTLVTRRASKESASFETLVPDYEEYGLKLAVNPEPLRDPDFRDDFPQRLGQDSELPVVVAAVLRGPTGDVPFLPVVHETPVPTTSAASQIARRGYMALRLAAWQPARPREFAEARDDILADWREHELKKRTQDRLESIRNVVTGGRPLAEAASEHGVAVSTLRRFNRTTPERRAPRVAESEPADSPLRATAASVKQRNFVHREYSRLLDVAPGKFRDDVRLDSDSDAGYLMRVVERHDPTPLEVPETELRTERILMMREYQQTAVELTEYETLARRFQLKIVEDKEPAEQADPEDEADASDTRTPN